MTEGRVCSVAGCVRIAVTNRTMCPKHRLATRQASAPECSISGCTSPAYGRGWCKKHHQRWLTHGDPLKVANNLGNPRWLYPCKEDGCTTPANGSRGWCRKHYTRWCRYGDPATNPREKAPRTCSRDGCDVVVLMTGRGSGLCRMCYQRLRRYGDASVSRPIRGGGCAICRHPEWEQIESELRVAQPWSRVAGMRSVEQRWGFSDGCASKHLKNHMDNQEHAEAMVAYELQMLAFLRATVDPA